MILGLKYLEASSLNGSDFRDALQLAENREPSE